MAGHEGKRKCTECSEYKFPDQFYRWNRGRDGLTPQCKTCRLARSARYRAANPGGRAGRDYPPAAFKVCHLCHQEKPGSAFSRNRTHSSGLQSYCRACIAAKQRVRLYGLTEEQVNQMTEAQGGACAACGEVTRLVIDHCHDTGHVRALLCNNCNWAEGLLRIPERARALARYMEAYAKSELSVPLR